jgi:excisionase family DNA binding protein
MSFSVSVVDATMDKVLTLEEVADYLKVHPSTVYRLVKKSQIPAFKIGSDWRFNQESVDRWMKARETDQGALGSDE